MKSIISKAFAAVAVVAALSVNLQTMAANHLPAKTSMLADTGKMTKKPSKMKPAKMKADKMKSDKMKGDKMKSDKMKMSKDTGKM